MTPSAEIRAARAANAAVMPGGKGRVRAFPGEIRAELVTKDGKQFYQVDGYASVFEKGYDMWDYFGPYTEVVDPAAMDASLGASPDVAFLVNHMGVTMARTTNDTLKLSKDDVGLRANAFLNAERQDVRDLASAVSDGLIDEMSFAFLLNDGEWSPDFGTFRITEADINRGDVSAVNYGANPFTSITARAADWLADAERMPVSVARAALARLRSRRDLVVSRAAADTDADGNVNSLIAALDSVLDQASVLSAGADRASLPEPVAQCLDMVTAAESIVDDLMELLGIYDPDDSGARSASRIARRLAAAPARPGASVSLVAMRLIAA